MGRGAVRAVRRGGRLRVDVRHIIDRPLHRLFGPRGHTVATTGCAAALFSLTRKGDHRRRGLLRAGSHGPRRGPVARDVGPRIVNIDASLGVPQAGLSAERNALNALIKVVAPTLYATCLPSGRKRARSACPSS